jgi:hypothetical protein
MIVKDIIDVGFQDYYKPYTFIATAVCDWKCCREQGVDISICQNCEVAKQKDISIDIKQIYKMYINNPISQAIVIGGLEPFLQYNDIYSLVKYFRRHKCKDDIVIYTGYYLNEIEEQINSLKKFENIIIKEGRFILNSEQKFDEVLKVNLNSNNQRGIKIS